MEQDYPEFAREREDMVRHHLTSRDIKDARVIETFRKMPREKFIESENGIDAYRDHPLPIGLGQTISQPYMVALMTQSLRLSSKDRVLEIGTGSGYQTAILAELAAEVFTVERIEELSRRAQCIIGDLGYSNVNFKVGDGTLGWEEHAPYDRILVTAGSPEVPQTLVEQLGDGGVMIIPVGERSRQELLRVEKKRGKIKQRVICGCVFVKLIGEEGWKEE